MKVYFNKSFWDKREEGEVGIPQNVDWNFTYDDQPYYIPVIYKFNEGITFDIISLIYLEKFLNFKEKYEHKINDMTEEEQLLLESIMPIKDLPIRKIYINDEISGPANSSSSSYIKGFYDKENNALLKIKNEYNFLQGEDISFHSERVHVKFSNKQQNEIHSLKFIMSKTEEIIPIKKHFKINLDMINTEYEQVFVHPITNKTYNLYIEEVKKYNAKEVFQQFDENNPYHYVGFNYELKPELPQDERLFLMEIKQRGQVKESHESSAIGIIGSSNQAISIYSKNDTGLGKHGYPINHMFTKMYWKELNYIELSIVGIYKEKYPEQEVLLAIN